MKMVFDGPGDQSQLPSLLEGYLYGLGEVCHTLFGSEGEEAMYTAIGSFFLIFLDSKMGITFTETDPWERYCHIVEVFTSYGFYSHVELEALSPNEYWMLETDQYAGKVWEEQEAWKRGTPPCPLWSIILHSLSEIGYTIGLGTVSYNEECNGYESTFYFKKLAEKTDDVMAHARKTLASSIITICANCKKIEEDDGGWATADAFFTRNYEAKFSHGLCPVCFKELYPYLTPAEDTFASNR